MIAHLLLGGVALAALMFAAEVAVGASRRLARSFGLSELLVGLTITSVGTSLPELATTVAGAVASGGSGGADAGALGIGNVLGSNVFMLSFLLGLTGLLAPLTVQAHTVQREGFAVVASLVAMFAVIVDGTVGRGESLALVGAYLLYLACLGVAAAVHPIPVPELAITFDWPFTAALSLVALALVRDRHEVTRYEGSALLVLFALYLYLRATLIR